MSCNDPNLISTEQEMKQAERLMRDYAWNGEESAYQRQKARFIRSRDLLLAGILYEPRY